MSQRKLDVVLDSVKRLMRMGATANLVNLLQKQHPADLAHLFSELPEKERGSAFSVLAERNSRLAMEGLSELGSRCLRSGCRGSPARRHWPPRPKEAGTAFTRRTSSASFFSSRWLWVRSFSS